MHLARTCIIIPLSNFSVPVPPLCLHMKTADDADPDGPGRSIAVFGDDPSALRVGWQANRAWTEELGEEQPDTSGAQNGSQTRGSRYGTICDGVFIGGRDSMVIGALHGCRFREITLAFPIKHHNTIDGLVGSCARTILHLQNDSYLIVLQPGDTSTVPWHRRRYRY